MLKGGKFIDFKINGKVEKMWVWFRYPIKRKRINERANTNQS